MLRPDRGRKKATPVQGRTHKGPDPADPRPAPARNVGPAKPELGAPRFANRYLNLVHSFPVCQPHDGDLMLRGEKINRIGRSCGRGAYFPFDFLDGRGRGPGDFGSLPDAEIPFQQLPDALVLVPIHWSALIDALLLSLGNPLALGAPGAARSPSGRSPQPYPSSCG